MDFPITLHGPTPWQPGQLAPEREMQSMLTALRALRADTQPNIHAWQTTASEWQTQAYTWRGMYYSQLRTTLNTLNAMAHVQQSLGRQLQLNAQGARGMHTPSARPSASSGARNRSRSSRAAR